MASHDRVSRRAAEPTAEERRNGTDDPEAQTAQAAQILAESDQRQASRDAAPTSFVEHRTSDEATPPPEA